ncbi:MAG: hypothetical protein ACEQSK_15045, partial [Sphingomonadaceae bacterium]
MRVSPERKRTQTHDFERFRTIFNDSERFPPKTVKESGETTRFSRHAANSRAKNRYFSFVFVNYRAFSLKIVRLSAFSSVFDWERKNG